MFFKALFTQKECLASKSKDVRFDLNCALQLCAFGNLLLICTFSHSRCTRSLLIGPENEKVSN